MLDKQCTLKNAKHDCTMHTNIHTSPTPREVQLKSRCVIRLWLNSSLILTADSTLTRLIWVRVESNLTHVSESSTTLLTSLLQFFIYVIVLTSTKRSKWLCSSSDYSVILRVTIVCHVFSVALKNLASMVKPGGILLIDHRNYDSILDNGRAPTRNIYYNVRLIYEGRLISSWPP